MAAPASATKTISAKTATRTAGLPLHCGRSSVRFGRLHRPRSTQMLHGCTSGSLAVLSAISLTGRVFGAAYCQTERGLHLARQLERDKWYRKKWIRWKPERAHYHREPREKRSCQKCRCNRQPRTRLVVRLDSSDCYFFDAAALLSSPGAITGARTASWREVWDRVARWGFAARAGVWRRKLGSLFVLCDPSLRETAVANLREVCASLRVSVS